MTYTEEPRTTTTAFELDRARLALRAEGHPKGHIACPYCLAQRTILQNGDAIPLPGAYREEEWAHAAY